MSWTIWNMHAHFKDYKFQIGKAHVEFQIHNILVGDQSAPKLTDHLETSLTAELPHPYHLLQFPFFNRKCHLFHDPIYPFYVITCEFLS